jgi:hypothetical protein
MWRPETSVSGASNVELAAAIAVDALEVTASAICENRGRSR